MKRAYDEGMDNTPICEVCEENVSTGRRWHDAHLCEDCWITRPIECSRCGDYTTEGLLDAEGRCEDCAGIDAKPDACPGCGCEPGDGVTTACQHPEGCGYWKEQA